MRYLTAKIWAPASEPHLRLPTSPSVILIALRQIAEVKGGIAKVAKAVGMCRERWSARVCVAPYRYVEILDSPPSVP